MTGVQPSETWEPIKDAYTKHSARVTRIVRDQGFGKLDEDEALRQLIFATNELVASLKETRKDYVRKTGNGTSNEVSSNTGESS